MAKPEDTTTGTITLGGIDTIDIQHDCMSPSIQNLIKAQSKLMLKASTIKRDAQGQYNYTSMDALLPKIKVMMKDVGITFFQSPVGDANEIGVRTIYAHTSGEYISSSYRVNLVNNPRVSLYQNAGQAITYFRRYALMSFVGLASGQDDDGVLKVRPLDNAEKKVLTKIYDELQEMKDKNIIGGAKHGELITVYLEPVKENPAMYETNVKLLQDFIKKENATFKLNQEKISKPKPVSKNGTVKKESKQS